MAMSRPINWTTVCDFTGSGSKTFTHTPIAHTPTFAVALTYSHGGTSPAVSSMDYGGDTMTEICGLPFTVSINRRIAVWGGGTNLAGAQTVTATFPTTSLFLVFFGTMTGGGLTAGPCASNFQSGSSTSSSITLASPDTDAMCVDLLWSISSTPGPAPQVLEGHFGGGCFGGSDFAHTSSEPGAIGGIDMSWTYAAFSGAAHVGAVIVDAAEGIVDGNDPPDPFEAPGGGGGGYQTGMSFPTYGVKGMFFPEPYFMTKSAVALAQQLNRLRIY